MGWSKSPLFGVFAVKKRIGAYVPGTLGKLECQSKGKGAFANAYRVP
jgi:hypothetical protein